MRRPCRAAVVVAVIVVVASPPAGNSGHSHFNSRERAGCKSNVTGRGRLVATAVVVAAAAAAMPAALVAAALVAPALVLARCRSAAAALWPPRQVGCAARPPAGAKVGGVIAPPFNSHEKTCDQQRRSNPLQLGTQTGSQAGGAFERSVVDDPNRGSDHKNQRNHGRLEPHACRLPSHSSAWASRPSHSRRHLGN